MATYEKHLGTLAAEEDGTRIELVQIAEPGETPTIEFRMQRHSESLGWMTHRRITFAAGQIGDLRAALNLMDLDAREATREEDGSKVESLFEVIPGGETKKSSG